MADRDFTVTCLCADWCGTCREYRAGFLALAAQFPAADFVWADVEEIEGGDDIEIDTFPTIVVKRSSEELFNGPLPPQHSHLKRLLEELLTS